jgi:hypothetical protein
MGKLLSLCDFTMPSTSFNTSSGKAELEFIESVSCFFLLLLHTMFNVQHNTNGATTHKATKKQLVMVRVILTNEHFVGFSRISLD